jgi:hypothetical protein
MKLLTRLLTKNLTRVPLLVLYFNEPHYKKYGKKDSCICTFHPILKNDEHLRETMMGLCDYIRDNYDMEKIV